MVDTIKKLWANHTFLASSSVASILLLLFFFILQILAPNILKMDTKWLIVAGCPLLFSLIGGGYIKTFKGFGIELETQLKTSIAESELLATDTIVKLPEDEKKSNNYLNRLTPEQRFRIERLTFYTNRPNYYNEYVVRRYLERLPNLKYLEVRNKNEIFICLLPIDFLRLSDNIQNRNLDYDFDEDRIIELILSLEKDNVTTAFATDVITERVAGSDPLIEILPIIRKQKLGVLGVVDNSGMLIGILNKHMVEEKIADEVLRARRRS